MPTYSTSYANTHKVTMTGGAIFEIRVTDSMRSAFGDTDTTVRGAAMARLAELRVSRGGSFLGTIATIGEL